MQNQSTRILQHQRVAVRTILAFVTIIQLTSCLNSKDSGGELDQQNERITHLEQKIDSLINANNSGRALYGEKRSDNHDSSGAVQQINRCQAITKKGTQCKRIAKYGGYCWQHRR
jgi:hypothetical protein